MLKTQKKESFYTALKNISDRGCFAIQSKGQRIILWSGNKQIIQYNRGTKITDIEENKKIVKTMFKAVRSSATRYIKKHDFKIPLVERYYPPIYTNKQAWNDLPKDSVFYYLDAKHCYWRIAYLLGYIAKGTYFKYCDNPNLKLIRNISLAVFNSGNKKEYYNSKGEKINEIECDTSLYQILYNNIRHYAYNNSGQILESINGKCIAYRVDGIFVLKSGLNKAKKVFEKNNLLYKVTKCIKVDEKNYSNEDGELKKIF